jgi:hypothetical protein
MRCLQCSSQILQLRRFEQTVTVSLNCTFRSPSGIYRLIMPRFLRLWLYARAFITRYPGFLRLRGLFQSGFVWGIIWTGFMMLRFYTTRGHFAIPPSEQSLGLSRWGARSPRSGPSSKRQTQCYVVQTGSKPENAIDGLQHGWPLSALHTKIQTLSSEAKSSC